MLGFFLGKLFWLKMCHYEKTEQLMDICACTLPESCIHMQISTYPETHLRSENECKTLYQVYNAIKIKKDAETHTLFTGVAHNTSERHRKLSNT